MKAGVPILIARAWLGLALFACLSVHAAPTTTNHPAVTHAVIVGQSFLEKAIRVREAATRDHPDVALLAAGFRLQGAQVHTLSEQQLTRAALHSTLESIRLTIKPQDSLVLYFAGFSEVAKDGPALFTHAANDGTDSLVDGSRRLPWKELQGWLLGTGAQSITVFLKIGPDAEQFCGPWGSMLAKHALTVLCQTGTGNTNAVDGSIIVLAQALKGEADTDKDGQLSNDELVAWLRRASNVAKGMTEVAIFQRGRSAPILALTHPMNSQGGPTSSQGAPQAVARPLPSATGKTPPSLP